MAVEYLHNNHPEWIELDENGRPIYPMARNLKVPMECIGLEYPAVPAGDKCSTQRLNMWTTSGPQALILSGAEFPQVASGYEKEYLKYTLNPSRFDQNSMILAVIPRYRTNVGMFPIKKCPSYLVIYYGEEDKKVHSMWVSSYTKGTNEFGWDNKIDIPKMRAGTPIAKNEVLTRTHAEQGSKYCMGVNATTMYATTLGTTEDAIVISDKLAKKCIAASYKEITVDIDVDDVPINLYGGEGVYKILPDVGEQVNDDGSLIALRKVDPMTYFTDMTKEALSKVQHLNDHIKVADVGTTVVDIEVYRNPNKAVLTQPHVFDQLAKYEDETVHFHKQILEVYKKECVEKGRHAGYTFNTVVTTAARRLTAVERRVLGVSRSSLAKLKVKENVIRFMQLKITLRSEFVPSRGYKFTSFFGNKGVLSQIEKEENMPILEDGTRVDYVTSPIGIPNRMNPAQIYITFLSNVCRVVLNKMKEHHPLEAYDILSELHYDVNPEYAALTDEMFNTNDLRIAYVEETYQRGRITLFCPPFLDTLTTEWVLKMRDKYDIRSQHALLTVTDGEGNVVRRVRSKNKFLVGEQYVFVLCKIPFCKGSSIGYVNDNGIPSTVKDHYIKSQHFVSPTNIKHGEDETRITNSLWGPVQAARLLAVNATSPTAVKKLGYECLTAARPADIQFINMTASDIVDSSRTIAAIRSMFLTCGIDLENSTASQEEINSFYSKHN